MPVDKLDSRILTQAGYSKYAPNQLTTHSSAATLLRCDMSKPIVAKQVTPSFYTYVLIPVFLTSETIQRFQN